ncbi:MAG: hypothetical protein HY541_06970 [Deltaproteobacteria bacterium]|nr:hypothetical protein [Deltaproteobacteria bacterium]
MCPTCWRENIRREEDHQYCIHCGDSIRLGREIAPPTKKKDVAVIFLKVSGYERDEPIQTLKNLQTLRNIISDIASTLGGYAKWMEGDEALLVFGTLEEEKNTPESVRRSNVMRALHAWRMIHEQIDPVESEDFDPSAVCITAGMHLGQVGSGVLGITGEKNPEVLGPDVNYASRVFGMALKKGGLVVSEPFLTALREFGLTTEVIAGRQMVSLKGFEGNHALSSLSLETVADIPYPAPAGLTRESDHSICSRHQKVETRFCPYCGNPSPVGHIEKDKTVEERTFFLLSIDVVRFSTVTANMDPADVFQWVNNFIGLAEPVIARHHGVTLSRRGDELVVRFGVPSVGNNALNAVLAALKIQEGVERFDAEGGIPPLHIRTGIHAGKGLVQGSITLSNSIRFARELQAKAPIDGLLIDEATAAEVAGFFVLEERESAQMVKGADTQAIELAGQKREEVPITGRESRLELLQHHFGQVVREGEPRVVVLTGEEGSGRQSVLRRFYSQEDQVIRLRGHGTEWQYDPLRAALRRRISEDAPSGLMFEESGELPYGFSSTAEMIFDLLSYYTGLSAGEGEGMGYLRQNPEQFKEWTVRAIALYLSRLARERPVVLELHPVGDPDPEFLAFLGQVLQKVGSHPLYLVLTSRNQPAQPLPWPAETISFPPLDHDATAELIWAVLSKEHSLSNEEEPTVYMDDELIDHLYNETKGHPSFVISWTRHYFHKGWIIHQDTDGKWHLNLPEGYRREEGFIDRILVESLDHLKLSAREKGLLAAAAVMAGRDGTFWPDGLVRLLDNGWLPGFESEMALHETLASLERRGVVISQPDSPFGNLAAYRLAPPALGQAVYRIYTTVFGAKQINLHREYAAWFGGLREKEEALGHAVAGFEATHQAGAGCWEEAYARYIEAIERAEQTGLNLNAEILHYSYKAEKVLERWNPSNRAEEEISLLLKRGKIFERTSDREKWETTLQRAEEIVERNGALIPDLLKITVLIARLGYTIKWENDPEKVQVEKRLLETRAADLPLALASRFYFEVARSFSFANWYDASLKAYDKAREYAEKSGDPRLIAKTSTGRSTLLGRLGKWNKSLASAGKASTLYKGLSDSQIGDRDTLCFCLLNMAECYLNLGRYVKASSVLDQAVQIARNIDNKMGLSYGLIALGIVIAYKGGQMDKAIEKIDEALRLGRQRQDPEVVMVGLFSRSMLVSRKNPMEGIENAEEALQLRVSPSYDAVAHFALGLASYRAGEIVRAERAVRRALEIRKNLGGPIASFDRELSEFAPFLFPHDSTPFPGLTGPSPSSPLLTDLILPQSEKPQSEVDKAEPEDDAAEKTTLPEVQSHTRNPLSRGMIPFLTVPVTAKIPVVLKLVK